MISAVLLRFWQWFTPRVALALSIAGMIAAGLLYTRKAGQQAERVESMKQTLKALRKRDAIHDDLVDDSRDELLDRMRDDLRD